MRESVGQTVTGFRVPDYDEENNLKSQLFGDFAKVLPDGVIEITGLKIDFYQEGEVGMTVTAPHCKYNQRRGLAESDSDVRIERENMVVTGIGFIWSGKEESFLIRQKAKVVLKDVRRHVKTGVEE
jgi:hypothetical protein